MRYVAIIDSDEKPVSCEFIGCNGNTVPYEIGTTTDIKTVDEVLKMLIRNGDEATNGDVIEAWFPNDSRSFLIVNMERDSWWNAPYTIRGILH